VTFLGPNRP